MRSTSCSRRVTRTLLVDSLEDLGASSRVSKHQSYHRRRLAPDNRYLITVASFVTPLQVDNAYVIAGHV
jgi:hypothetical protein